MLDFTRFLAREVETAQGLTKGQSTRLRIKAAAARILADKGYHDLHMADIAEEAGVSYGAVYRYFENKRDVTFEVLREQSERTLALLLPSSEHVSAYQRIHVATRKAIDSFRANVGLMRCLRQLADEYREFDVLTMENNARWYRLVASGLARRAGTTRAAKREAFGVASALGGMVDEMLHNVFVREDPTLDHFRRSPEKLATALSVLWYRAAYAENPPVEEVGRTHPLLDLVGDGERR